MVSVEGKERALEAIDDLLRKLRTIRRLVRLNGLVADYHVPEVRELVDSLRHWIDKWKNG